MIITTYVFMAATVVLGITLFQTRAHLIALQKDVIEIQKKLLEKGDKC